MKWPALQTLVLSLWACPVVLAREVLVDDPGAGNTVHLMQLVPDILGFPENNDPTLKVISNVPVSILRYYDSSYLEGQQPVQKQDVYITVKSDCSSTLDVRLALTKYDRSNYSYWDTFSYTESISIDVVPSDDSVTLMDTEFLEPSTFLAYWNYSSFWCNEGVPGLNDTVTVNPGPVLEEITPAPAPTTINIKESELPDDISSATLAADSAPKNGMLTTIMAALLGATWMLRDVHRTKKGHLTMLVGFAVMGALLVSFHTMKEENVSQEAIQLAPTSIHGRRLQDQTGETCSASVEIIIDACRRSMLESKVDMEVEAPALRILGKYHDVANHQLCRNPISLSVLTSSSGRAGTDGTIQ